MKKTIGFILVATFASGLASASAGPAAPYERLPIYFAEHASELTSEAKAVIDEAAGMIQEKSARTIILVGLTERTGDAKADQRLSEARASAIERELLVQGVSPERIAVTSGELTASTGAGMDTPFAGRTAEIIIQPNDRVGL